MCLFNFFEEEEPKNKRVALNPLMRKALIDDLAKKQGGRCMYCGRKVVRDLFDLDHKNPVARGGTNRTSNFQLLCRTCNTRKGAMTDREFRRKYKSIGVPQTQVLPKRAIPQRKFEEAGKTPASKGRGGASARKRSTSRHPSATRAEPRASSAVGPFADAEARPPAFSTRSPASAASMLTSYPSWRAGNRHI